MSEESEIKNRSAAASPPQDKPEGKHGLVFSPTADEAPTGGAPAGMKKRGGGFRSIRFNLWVIFMLMTAFMLGIVWIFEIIFYSTFYVGFQRGEISRIGDLFVGDYYAAVEDGADEDEMIEEAIDVIMECHQASTSMLQRRLKLGYSRAARIIDQIEERGIIGPFEGSKPRQILISKEEWQEMKLRRHDPLD